MICAGGGRLGFQKHVLGTMFYRYISENLTNYINQGEWDAGNSDFDYAKMSDSDAEEAREGLIEEKGFFILPSELFCNVQSAASSETAMFRDREGKLKSVKDNLNAQRKEDKHFSHLARYEEIAENDYNLSVSTYAEAEDTREKIDIRKLNAQIEEIVAREETLRKEIAAIIQGIEGADA